MPELADAAVADLPLDTSPQRQLLQLIAPDGKYNLLHDRRWHTFWDDPKLVVLKRFDKGRVIAHCNLATGPSVGKGKHQDPGQFRDDIRRSLKERFVQFLGAGKWTEIPRVVFATRSASRDERETWASSGIIT